MGVSKSRGRCREDLEVLLLVGCLTDQFETWQRSKECFNWTKTDYSKHLQTRLHLRWRQFFFFTIEWLTTLPGIGLGSSGSRPWRGAGGSQGRVQLSSPLPLSSPPPWRALRRRRPGMCGWAGDGEAAGAVSGAGGVAQWSAPRSEHRWEDPQHCGRWSSDWDKTKYLHISIKSRAEVLTKNKTSY